MEDLNQIITNFKINQIEFRFEPLTNGLINDTYLVSSKKNQLYILQKINTRVFSNVSSLISNIDLVLPKLASPNYQKVSLEKSLTGETFYKSYKQEVWRLMTYVKDSKVFNTTEDKTVAYEAGKIIGFFHELLSGMDTSLLQATLVDFHNLDFRYGQFLDALAKANPENIEKAKDAISFVKENISHLLDIEVDKLPIRTCHNDTKLNNILFSDKNKAMCLIDLDTIMPGLFLYDFGDAVRTIVNRAPEDEINLELITFDKNLFKAFVEGLSLNKHILKKTEIDYLPLGPALMPFLHGIRALTDYLENNKYYKVKYENQNLDRCKSLFQFSKLAIENRQFMEQCINEIFDK